MKREDDFNAAVQLQETSNTLWSPTSNDLRWPTLGSIAHGRVFPFRVLHQLIPLRFHLFHFICIFPRAAVEGTDSFHIQLRGWR